MLQVTELPTTPDITTNEPEKTLLEVEEPEEELICLSARTALVSQLQFNLFYLFILFPSVGRILMVKFPTDSLHRSGQMNCCEEHSLIKQVASCSCGV